MFIFVRNRVYELVSTDLELGDLEEACVLFFILVRSVLDIENLRPSKRLYTNEKSIAVCCETEKDKLHTSL